MRSIMSELWRQLMEFDLSSCTKIYTWIRIGGVSSLAELSYWKCYDVTCCTEVQLSQSNKSSYCNPAIYGMSNHAKYTVRPRYNNRHLTISSAIPKFLGMLIAEMNGIKLSRAQLPRRRARGSGAAHTCDTIHTVSHIQSEKGNVNSTKPRKTILDGKKSSSQLLRRNNHR